MKEKALKLLSYLLVAAVASAATFGAILWFWGGNSKLDELEYVIYDYYIEDADFEAIEDAAASAMVDALADRWSYYIPASQMAAYTEGNENAYVGIGVTIMQHADGKGIEVTSVNPGSSAEAAGIRVGDYITAIEGQPAADMTTIDARNIVRGEEGTMVSMTLKRGETEWTVSVERRRVEVVVAEGTMLDGKVGMVTIANFDSRCAQETIAVMEELVGQGAQALIFDVRNNPGGYAEEMIQILDYLLPEGPLFRTVDYTGKETVDSSDEKYLELPMVVLVNGESYSAAEFFAAALREYDAAMVVGGKTSGKGYFQNTIPLSDGSAVALSTGKYFTPNGNSLEGVGLIPDVEITADEEMTMDIYRGTLDAKDDPYIQAALELLEG